MPKLKNLIMNRNNKVMPKLKNLIVERQYVHQISALMKVILIKKRQKEKRERERERETVCGNVPQKKKKKNLWKCGIKNGMMIPNCPCKIEYQLFKMSCY